MTWQEPIVILIVGGAVVSLYRHLRGMLAVADPGVEASCHGCDECDEAAPPSAVEMAERSSR